LAHSHAKFGELEAATVGPPFALLPVMPVTSRVIRTLLGVMLAVLLGMLVAPLAWIHPR